MENALAANTYIGDKKNEVEHTLGNKPCRLYVCTTFPEGKRFVADLEDTFYAPAAKVQITLGWKPDGVIHVNPS